MRVCKRFRFAAAHYLPYYDGKCKDLHGHTWTLEVEIEGNVAPNGMVLDFALLKNAINKLIVDELDHKLLNDIGGLENPTCENIVMWIYAELCAHDTYLFKISRLRLYETYPDSYAEEIYSKRSANDNEPDRE